MDRLEIGIAGAGPAGLAAALYLNRLGHRVTVFDQFEQPEPVGSGLMLQPTGEAVLRDLGLWAPIEALGQTIDRLEGRDAKSGRMVLDVRYENLPWGGRALGVHRNALFSTLNDAVLSAGISIVPDSRIVDTTTEAASKRNIITANGERHGPFDLVIDALGARSQLRQKVAPETRVRPLTYGAIWTSVVWRDGFACDALNQRYNKASTMIGVLPIGQATSGGPKLATFFWSLKEQSYAALLAGGLDVWKAHVRHYWPETEVLLAQISGFDQMVLARYAHHTMMRPYASGLAHIGDSAHATSPQLGQGANMGLLDARALFVAMRDATSIEVALAEYARLRRWHIRLYQAMSLQLTPLYQSDSTNLAVLRDLLVSGPGRLPLVRRFLSEIVAGCLLDPRGRLGLNP